MNLVSEYFSEASLEEKQIIIHDCLCPNAIYYTIKGREGISCSKNKKNCLDKLPYEIEEVNKMLECTHR